MIVSFSVENFRSIKNKQTLSFEVSQKEHSNPETIFIEKNLQILPVVAIYGANAAGKSNILRSMSALKRLVRSKHTHGEKLRYEPFRLSGSSLMRPTIFQIEFIAFDDLRYDYRISFNGSKILSESLSYYEAKHSRLLFERRDGLKIKYGPSLKGPKALTERQLLKNQLFLSKGASNNIDQLKVPYNFLAHELYMHVNSKDSFLSSLIKVVEHQKYDRGLYEKINKLLKIGDIGITSFSYKEDEPEFGLFSIEKEKSSSFRNSRSKLRTQHAVLDDKWEVTGFEEFSIGDESVGTIKLMAVGGMIFNMLEYGGIFVIDELDNSLHPHLSRLLLLFFANKKINKENAQLIFATHDVTLLTNSEVLDRDQIWFTEKNPRGETELYSLADIKGIKKDAPLDKWYMSGRFGAIPNISDLEREFSI